MHVICCVKPSWSTKVRLRGLSLQLTHLSVFPLTKRVFRDALDTEGSRYDYTAQKSSGYTGSHSIYAALVLAAVVYLFYSFMRSVKK